MSYEDLATADLCDRFSRSIRLFVIRRLGAGGADDIVQNVLLSVMTAIKEGQLRDPACLAGFVRTVTLHAIGAEIGNRLRHRTRMVDIAEPGLYLSDGLDPEILMQRRQRVELAGRILEGMPPRDGEILRRFYVNEEPQEQIIAEMRLTMTQFRLMKSRAKARFGEYGREIASRARFRASEPSPSSHTQGQPTH
jgi:RNA polymerase sigma-70 factor (ECF subfamily)